ncbi:MAG: GNAT family N-acetyltransferase [Burkholderiales bacterium]|nr:GNAT family N-acetyltransferase [Burkholderiales bacterium]
MMIALAPFNPAALPALQAIADRIFAPWPAPRLAQDLTDLARARGDQVVVACRDGQPIGCAGWVTLGIAQSGCLYGAPVISDDTAALDALIAYLITTASQLGASQLSIGCRAGEDAKRTVLASFGFTQSFEWLHFAKQTAETEAADFARLGLQTVPIDDLDWSAVHSLYAETFQNVPNAPIPSVEAMKAEWIPCNWDAGCVLADASGRYRAFMLIDGDEVSAVGIDPSLRGQGIADQLYRRAGFALHGAGTGTLRALVASSNHASVRLHQRFGFTEEKPRGEVLVLSRV